MDDKKLVKKNIFEEIERTEGLKPKRKEAWPEPEPVTQPEQQPVVKEDPVVEKPETTNLLAELTQKKKPVGKGCNVYLDADVIEKLDKLAKQTKTNRSKVINTLLRNLLADK